MDKAHIEFSTEKPLIGKWIAESKGPTRWLNSGFSIVSFSPMSFIQRSFGRAIYAVILLILPAAFSADVSSYRVEKGIEYAQISASAPVVMPQNGFAFSATVEASQPGFITSASVQPPTSAAKTLAPDSDNQQFKYKKKYDFVDKLNENFPNANYPINIVTLHEGAKTLSLPLAGDAYAPTPHLLNFDAAQNINAGGYFLFRWEYTEGGATPSFVQLHIDDANGNKIFESPDNGPLALDSSATSYLMPPGALEPNQTYNAYIIFRSTTASDQTSYPGASGSAGYYKRTEFTVKTLPASITADVQSFSLTKLLVYEQGVTTPPVSGSDGFELRARVNASSANAVLATDLIAPNGSSTNLTLSSDGTKFDLKDKQPTLDFLNAAYPDGTYTFKITGKTEGNKSATLALQGDSYPPIPKFLNTDATQKIDSSQDLVLQWEPFARASRFDYIQVQIDNQSGNKIYDTANYGKASALNGLDTSAKIPSGTLKPASIYTAKLYFLRVPNLNTTSYPGALGLSGFARETHLQIKTIGTNTPPLVMSEVKKLPQGFQFKIQGPAPLALRIFGSSDLRVWEEVGQANLTGVDVTFLDPNSHSKRFYRIVGQ
jgi:hypothetical protein